MNILAVDSKPCPVKVSVWLNKDMDRQLIKYIDDVFSGEDERRRQRECRMRCIEHNIDRNADMVRKFFMRKGMALAAEAPAEKRSAVVRKYYARMKEVLDGLSQEEAKNG